MATAKVAIPAAPADHAQLLSQALEVLKSADRLADKVLEALCRLQDLEDSHEALYAFILSKESERRTLMSLEAMIEEFNQKDESR